jgi:cardiolipin synthase
MNHSIRDEVSIFVAVVFVCVVLLLSIVIWSIRRHRDPKLHIECSSPIDELIPSLAGLTLSTAVAGNSVEVLENGAFFEVLLQQIRSAQQSVHFETFLWKRGCSVSGWRTRYRRELAQASRCESCLTQRARKK